jgi:hypothetical protein
MSNLGNNIDPAVQQHRIEVCCACAKNVQMPWPHCAINDIPISVLTSEEQETCPLDKW